MWIKMWWIGCGCVSIEIEVVVVEVWWWLFNHVTVVIADIKVVGHLPLPPLVPPLPLP